MVQRIIYWFLVLVLIWALLPFFVGNKVEQQRRVDRVATVSTDIVTGFINLAEQVGQRL